MGRPSAGNQPPTKLLAVDNNPQQSPRVSICDKVESVKSSIITILTVTVWPSRSNNIAQDLLQIIENASSLKNIPKDDACIQAEHRDLLERFLRGSEIVRDTLKQASKTYGEKEGRLDTGIKRFFSSLKPNKCRDLLEYCQAEVKKALSLLPDRWNDGSVDAATSTTLPAQDQDLITADDRAKANPGDPNWLRAVKVTFSAVETVSGAIPIIGSYVGAAANVGTKVVEMIQNMNSNEEAAKDLCICASRLSEILKNFQSRSIETRKDDLTKYITELQRQLQLVQRQVDTINSSGTLSKALFADEHASILKGYQEAIRVALNQMQLLVSLNITSLITELYDKEALKEQRRLVNLLGDATYGARGTSIEDVVCLPGTRVQVLDRINAWIRSASASERVLWMRGMAGRGKSTIASTIAHQWKHQAATAIFHFRCGQRGLDQRLICALARQLGRSDLVPQVKEAILQNIAENEDIAQERLTEQFLKLLIWPLAQSNSSGNSRPILLIVDALDECDDLEYAVNFVRLIDEHSVFLSSNVKFLLTSRPEEALLRALEPRQWIIEDLDLLEHTNDDVAQFLQQGFSRIREYNLGEDWPHSGEIGALVNMSQGLFQWAHTVIQYLMEGSPQLRLEELMTSPSACDGLDDLYLQILSKAHKKAKKSPAREGLFIRMLGSSL